MQIYTLKCEMLTPVHIGSGEALEPFDYVIRENTFYRIALEDCLFDLSGEDRARFDTMIEKNDLNGIRRLIEEKADLNKTFYTSSITEGVQGLYREKMGDVRNQLIVNSFIREGHTHRAYIPGSSLKGSIRTAVVSMKGQGRREEFSRKVESGLKGQKSFLFEKGKRPDQEIKQQMERDIEKLILGHRNPQDDPFRALKISDACLPGDATVVSEVKNVGRREGHLSPDSIQMMFEVTRSYISDGDRSSGFEAMFAVDDDLQKAKGVSQRLSIEDIVKSCQEFYADKARKDHDFFENSVYASYAEQIIGEAQKTSSDTFLVRVGRFSGVWSVTLDEYRDPQTPKGIYGKTRNLADGRYPMGWVKVTVS